MRGLKQETREWQIKETILMADVNHRDKCRKPIVYVDMDNVLVDFPSGIAHLDKSIQKEYEGRLDKVPGIFSLMKPIDGAIDAIFLLAQDYDLYILSTAPWLNESAWSDKLRWVQRYFGKGSDSIFYKRLIISHHKNLCRGAFLIDDREKNGAKDFVGELIRFGSKQFPNWEAVVRYLLWQSEQS